ncbi:MAG TPA: hypothetical protein VHP33_02920 [Polyangiaceae bacterium]|nr:hypothetical protein [Polyangiaceae bacterium]
MLGGCDIAAPDPPSATGPAVHVVGVYPGDGCGVGPDPDCTVPLNPTLTFRFDRFLDPVSASRQAIRVYTGDPMTSPGPPPFAVSYDPVERVVEYRTPPGYALLPNTLYQLELVVPNGVDDAGFRAFDGAPLAEGELPLNGSFLTGDAVVDQPLSPAPSCAEIVGGADSLFKTCVGAACHQKGDNAVGGKAVADAPHGLWLDTPKRFTLSAVGRIARETEVDAQSGGSPTERGPRFGVGLALVDARNPGGSYLMYKLLRNPSNFEPCPQGSTAPFCSELADPAETTHPQLPLGRGELVTPPPEELERLREWFVRGDPMPRPRADGKPLSVHLQGLRAVSRFIAAGADCDE